jgi:hypothetical protein
MDGVHTFSTRQSSLGESNWPFVVVSRPGSPAWGQIDPNSSASFTPGHSATRFGGLKRAAPAVDWP